jgi:biotin-dependent carboxylase-like uncharacterized protein
VIKIIRAGRLNSVQDMGREHFRHLGICQSGALDRTALSIANMLVGNPCEAAAIEFTLGPCELQFMSDCRIALGGADFGATLNERPLPPWWSVRVRAGQTLRLNAARHGMRGYLAVAGGFNSAQQLGSRSTDLQARFGGHGGRPLTEGDSLTACHLKNADAAIHTAPSFGVRAPSWYNAHDSKPLQIRVIPGPEYDSFTATAQRAFWDGTWTLTTQSNRMGFRPSGPELKIKKSHDLLSHGVLPGVIQVPPAGQPIVLMADAQTTGGYPKIGVVIGADLAKLAQLRFNRTLRFVACDAAQAREELRRDNLYLQQIAAAMHWLRPARDCAAD